jgi:hypothetical protein
MSEKIEILVPEGKVAKQVTNGNNIYITFEDGPKDLSVKVPTVFIEGFISDRVLGEYSNKAFYLYSCYSWELKKDSDGSLCLIPTRKPK